MTAATPIEQPSVAEAPRQRSARSLFARFEIDTRLLGMLAALVPSIVLLARHGSAARKMGIPFAPFLALGALIALFAGHSLLDAYLSTF